MLRSSYGLTRTIYDINIATCLGGYESLSPGAPMQSYFVALTWGSYYAEMTLNDYQHCRTFSLILRKWLLRIDVAKYCPGAIYHNVTFHSIPVMFESQHVTWILNACNALNSMQVIILNPYPKQPFF